MLLQKKEEPVTESREMKAYFDRIENDVNVCYDIATKARKKGYDPEDFVDIKLAKNMAERVEGLMSAVAPQLVGKGLPKRIVELEKKYSPMDWRVALLVAAEVAREKFCTFKDKKEAMEIGIRAGFAYNTGGIVAAPLEGFIELRIKNTKDGKQYFAPCYAGPIRGAGGTAAALSLIITDYVRKEMGYAKYDPDDNEVNRFKAELADYHERITNLQYFPSAEEIDFLVRHCPIEIDGDPTEKLEVSNYKDIPRVETNRIRGGVALVLGEGLSQKAPKLWKRLEKWGDEMGLEWGFLKDFLALQKKIKSKQKEAQKTEKVMPNYTFINDLVAGRPVLTHPMRAGGFRLRYGRNRCSGFSAASISPATMCLLKDFIATGTQLKLERPGKAASMTPCDTIYGPIVKLKDGSVMRINSVKKAKEYKNDIVEIIFMGDLLINYGDFSENNHILVPCGFNEEWWVRELEKATVEAFGMLDRQKLSELSDISQENLEILFSEPIRARISFRAALGLSKKLGVPLHPDYLQYWSLISKEELLILLDDMHKANIVKENDLVKKAIFAFSKKLKAILEKIGIPHICAGNEFIVLKDRHASSLLLSLGMMAGKSHEYATEIIESSQSTLEAIGKLSGVRIMDKAGTFIGARMGRPEKAKMRRMTGSPQTLFPVGDEGGRLRSFQSSLEVGKINGDFPLTICPKCQKKSIYHVCEGCAKKTKQLYICDKCGESENEVCGKCNTKNKSFARQDIPIRDYFDAAVKKTGSKVFPDLIKGVRGTSNKDHIPEYLLKGILRAKHDIYVNKDGTIRYDMSELPITHFKPLEVGTDIEKLKELGYTHDIKGKPLEDIKQILEIKPQDIILPSPETTIDEPADKVVFRIANFIDELLVVLYGLEPFYKLESEKDIIGHYVIGLAPHISAGTVGRIVGFSRTQGMLAHPLMHAAMRRDCDGDEACIILLMDGLLNFSRQYLPDSRGAKTMDAPLVMTSKIIPAEVDDMAHGLDVVWDYPLELYYAALEYKPTFEIKISQIKEFLNTERQYEKMGFTHDTSNLNLGVNFSAYKSLPSMEEKLKGQMDLATLIRAVDAGDVARLVIEKHLVKDTKGNLRKFSTQSVRCVKCNEKFRRPPLIGCCTACGGKIIFTVSQGSVVKYLEPSISLAENYNVPVYLQQSLALLKMRIESVFGKEKEIQEGLGKWFG